MIPFLVLLLVRLEGRLFYANAANVQDKVRAIHGRGEAEGARARSQRRV